MLKTNFKKFRIFLYYIFFRYYLVKKDRFKKQSHYLFNYYLNCFNSCFLKKKRKFNKYFKFFKKKINFFYSKIFIPKKNYFATSKKYFNFLKKKNMILNRLYFSNFFKLFYYRKVQGLIFLYNFFKNSKFFYEKKIYKFISNNIFFFHNHFKNSLLKPFRLFNRLNNISTNLFQNGFKNFFFSANNKLKFISKDSLGSSKIYPQKIFIIFLGLIQVINFNLLFRQYSFDIYNGFKLNFDLLLFTTFFFTKYSFNFLNRFYLFLFKFYKTINAIFINKLKRFIYITNIKTKIFLYKKRYYDASSVFSKQNFHMSNNLINRYVYFFSKIFLSSFRNSFIIFSWKNINNLLIKNNYKIFKYLKLKRINLNNISSKLLTYKHNNFFTLINNAYKFLLYVFFYFKTLKGSYIYIYSLYLLLFRNLNNLCRSLIN